MSGQVTITQLPTASALTGNESVPIVQNGVTVQTTTGAIAVQPTQTQTFLTVGQQTSLANSRQIAVTTGLTFTDGGAQGSYTIAVSGALASLISSGTGIQVKTDSTTLTPRQITTGTGLSVSNADGVSGNPLISLASFLASIQSLSGSTGLVAVSGGSATSRAISSVTNQTSVTNADASSGNPTIGIASNPVIPGTASLTFPIGASSARPSSPVNGMFRYNTTTATFEGYANNAWGSVTTGSGVTSIATGTGLTGGPITSSGTISIDVTGVSANTYGSASAVAVFTVNAQGQLTSATTTTISIPSSAINTAIPNASLTNSTVTIGTTSIALGATSLTLGGLTTVTVTQDPVSALQLATKQYVDNIAQGLDTKASVVNGSTANFTATYSNGTLGVGATLTNSSTLVAFSADGITNSVGDRVLIKNQTTSAQNGIYTVTTVGSASVAWVLTRATDMDVWAEVPSSYVFVETGSTLADTGWVCTSNQGGTMGTTAITWAQFSGSGSGVSSITFGTTGLTPSTATTGAVTVAGTLATTNGGTNLTSFTSGGAVYATSTSVLTTGTLPNTAGGTGQSSAFTQYGVTYASSTTALATTSAGTSTTVLHGNASGAPTFGAVSLTADVSGTLPVANGGTGITSLGTGVATALGVNVGSSGAFVVNGGALGTPSSGTVTNLTGTASININGTVGATTASTGAFTTVSATGVITSTVATGTAPFTVSSTTQVANLNVATAGTATNATNVASSAGSGATNYLHFSSSATGNVAVNTNTSLTYNYTNNTLTAGINGGTF